MQTQSSWRSTWATGTQVGVLLLLTPTPQPGLCVRAVCATPLSRRARLLTQHQTLVVSAPCGTVRADFSLCCAVLCCAVCAVLQALSSLWLTSTGPTTSLRSTRVCRWSTPSQRRSRVWTLCRHRSRLPGAPPWLTWAWAARRRCLHPRGMPSSAESPLRTRSRTSR